MPRNQPTDWEMVYKAIDESPSLSAAARKLGLHFNTVWRATKRREGLCHRCFQHPVTPPSLHCDGCILAMREYQRKRRVTSHTKQVCRQCGAPVAPWSRTFCEHHRQLSLKNARNKRDRDKAKDIDGFLAKQRAHNRRQKYGEDANTLWERTGGTCSICAAPYRKRRTHIHHIDGDDTNHAPSNLVVVCWRCHRLIHALSSHPKAGLVIAWCKEIYVNSPQEEPETEKSGPFRKWEWRTSP